MKAFVLAGGFATRLWPLTESRAKPLLPVAGKPIISHLVEKIPADIPVTVSTNASFGESFAQWIRETGRKNMELVVEGTAHDDHKLGALGALAQWITDEKIDDDLLVLTGDNYLGFSLEDFVKAFTGKPLLAAHDIGDLDRARAFGTVLIEGERRVRGFEEKPPHPKSTLVSAGCVILPKSTLPLLLAFAKTHPDNLGGIFEEYLRKNMDVECFVFTEPWIDIGSFGSYLDGHRTLVDGRTMVDPSSRVSEAECTGSVCAGKNCIIENSELIDCILFDNVQVRNCTLTRCIIDNDCVLAGIDLKDKMLRAGTRLVVEGIAA